MDDGHKLSRDEERVKRLVPILLALSTITLAAVAIMLLLRD